MRFAWWLGTRSRRSLRNGLAYDKRGEFDEATKQYAASLDLLPKLAGM